MHVQRLRPRAVSVLALKHASSVPLTVFWSLRSLKTRIHTRDPSRTRIVGPGEVPLMVTLSLTKQSDDMLAVWIRKMWSGWKAKQKLAVSSRAAKIGGSIV